MERAVTRSSVSQREIDAEWQSSGEPLRPSYQFDLFDAFELRPLSQQNAPIIGVTAPNRKIHTAGRTKKSRLCSCFSFIAAALDARLLVALAVWGLALSGFLQGNAAPQGCLDSPAPAISELPASPE